MLHFAVSSVDRALVSAELCAFIKTVKITMSFSLALKLVKTVKVKLAIKSRKDRRMVLGTFFEGRRNEVDSLWVK